MRTKWCRTCMSELTLGVNWPEHRQKRREYRCAPCLTKKARVHNETYREKNRESARIAAREWRERNPDKYQSILEAAKQRRKSHD